MLVFEQYDGDTWGIEWGDYLCLIKRAQEQYTAVVGTMQDAMWIGHGADYNAIKSRAIRAMIVLYNEADIDRVKIWVVNNWC